MFLLLQTGPVQNFLIHQAGNRLSKALNTEVRVSRIDLAFFNKLELEGTLVRDRNKDTLLYAGALKVNITDWFFLKDKIELKYIGLENTVVYLHRRDSVWNYQFLVDYFSSPTPSKKDKQPIELSLRTVDLKNIRLLQEDEWRGENLGLSLGSLHLNTKTFDLKKKEILIEELALVEPVFSIYNYDGRRPPRAPRPPSPIPPNDPRNLRWNAGKWKLAINLMTIRNGSFRNDLQTDREPYYFFDGAHFQWASINSRFEKVRLENDTISGNINIATKERSGFEVKQLKANLRWHPEAMEFHKLDIRTNKSRLKKFFAMRYKTFDDMSDFLNKVTLEGDMEEAIIDSDDIAYFAPEMANWKKRLTITGIVKGPISNLSSKNIMAKAGQGTVLQGDFALRGLPDIDQTFLDCEVRAFHTTYEDALRIIPELKDIKTPRLDKLQYVNFKGNFTGFIKDFVTYGTIETALGTLITDVNMKFPDKGSPIYSGNISTNPFDLGSFIDNSQLGKFAFEGSVKGKGFTLKTLDAQLKGIVPYFEYNGHSYNDIAVDGKVANKLFNGNLVVNDAFLEGKLKGLVDLSGKVPRFDFNALINNANLRNLNFSRDEIDFAGTFDINFVGDKIDNFLGSARVSNASIFKNGQRISFDSLYIESSRINATNKTITVKSNEFEGVLAGEFNISSLPDAFQTFLNRYYPSYIRASSRKTSNNFSFFITTRKVDDYLDLLDKNLKGFNYATINGRVNNKENIFDLDAEIPQFGYKNLAVYDLKFQGRGNYDSLSVATDIGDIYINDSLHFPDSHLDIRSSNDISQVNISTSASQTLNRANISGEVQTLKNGVRIMFNPSSFDINKKEWVIDQGGELILTKELVTSDGLRIYSGDQEIKISSVPSAIGRGNDLKIDLQKINIGDFTPFFVKTNRIEGLLSGNIEVIDPFNNLQVEVAAKAEQFRLDNDSIGVLDLNSTFSQKSGRVSFKAVSVNKDYNFDLAGLVNTKDTLNEEINIVTRFEETRINLLQQYLGGIFSKMNGYANGTLQIVGKSSSLRYLGSATLHDAGMMVDYTKVYYKIPKATIEFKDGLIDFGKIEIQDTLGNKGEITEGKLYHNAFKDMAFDFRVKTNKMLLLNTTNIDNKLFYGTVIGKAELSFSGPMDDMEMAISGEPTAASTVYLATSSGRESAEADFIVWKEYGKEMETYRPYSQESKLTMTMDITANPLADVYMIIDEKTGDVINAKGSGKLKMRVGTTDDLTLSGRYEIESGQYNFNLQSLKKNFILLPGRNNSITWNGDPYEAILKIDALYEADNAKFSDLMATGISSEDVKRFRGTVYVVASITDRLTQPRISFQIELPQNSPLKNNAEALGLLTIIQKDENELNKQVSYLILLNTFGPLSTSGNAGSGSTVGSAAFESLVISSISGLVSTVLTNELSKAFQKIFNDKSLKVNLDASFYSGTNITGQTSGFNLPDRTNVNLKVAKSYMNERLTFVVGSAIDFGISAAQSSTFQFLPDVTAEYKLTPDGKFRVTFFYRNNWSYIAQNALARSGISLAYRRDFDKINEILRRKKKKANKGKEGPPVTDSIPQDGSN
ncbi:translocation/assembly module TamB [Flavihumibacter rivuli]|uniref:translocation/assembly module TamB domain-containing protein n=1 Tax=Flavihumibacter rivuli TaxID=2838156 RepID=UPI001BDF0C2E|nr:translocation/assembly module TamB domain-containing protein [Flavihumibacter rivuli]ULQ57066.1 translocation/assembly module TamB [Flavihumibacter rivuli]